ncbi:MAG: 50S ribosomal protein L29 [Nanoarchaeota archaeon]|nr:50S ribosomal protein L29 [Nanoarchaeota archaeon]
MKAKEIRSTDKGTIDEKISELKKELVKINAQVAIGTALKNPGEIKKIKKMLARILTINYEKTKKNLKK